jgi:hypothetical protein
MVTESNTELTVKLATQGFLLLIGKHTPELIQRNGQVQTLVKHAQGLYDKITSHRLVNIHSRDEVYQITAIMEKVCSVIATLDKNDLSEFAAYLGAFADKDIAYLYGDIGNKIVEMAKQQDIDVVKKEYWHYTLDNVPEGILIVLEREVEWGTILEFAKKSDGIICEQTGNWQIDTTNIVRWRIAGAEYNEVITKP